VTRLASSVSILVLDASGTPRRWIELEDAAGYYCKQQVAWDLGDNTFTLRGGISRATGQRSTLTLRSIVAVRSDSGRRAPTVVAPALARDMLLTGRTATADEALAWGLVARLAEPEALLAEALEVVASIARTAPDARNEVKRVFDRYYGAYDRIAMQHSLSGPEPVEGFMAFKERRNPNWVASDLRTEGRL